MKRLLAFGAALALSACAMLGVPAADTFNKKLVTGYSTVEFVAETAQNLVTAGKLSPADRINVVSTNSTALTALDLARSVHATTCPAGSPPTCVAPAADAKLQTTLTVLQALQAYLATQGAHP